MKNVINKINNICDYIILVMMVIIAVQIHQIAENQKIINQKIIELIQNKNEYNINCQSLPQLSVYRVYNLWSDFGNKQ